MPPKKKAEVFEVDGVACSVTSAKDQGTAYVKIGTSGFSHDQRITFRLSQLPGAASREEQVRAHKGWPALLAASRSKGVESGGGSAQPCARESLEASAGERPASSGCVACEGDDCEAALNSTDGRFYCEECVDDPANEGSVRQAAEEQLAARAAAAAAQQPPVPPPLELRRSPREVQVVSRLDPEWSAYRMDHTGERHARTRDESYDELSSRVDQLDTDVKAAALDLKAATLEKADLAANLDRVFRQLKELAARGAPEEADLAGQCEVAAAVLLREAIYELTQDWDRRQEASEEGVPRTESDAEAHAASGAEAATPSWVASSVRVGGVDGAVGQLSINAPYLSWTPTPAGASDEPAQRVELRDVLYAEIDDDDDVRPSSWCCLGARGRECGASAMCVVRDCDVIDCIMRAQLLVADSQDVALRVELAVHMTDGDTRMFYFPRIGSGVLERESFAQRLTAAADTAQEP
jgi:hypothetical protein